MYLFYIYIHILFSYNFRKLSTILLIAEQIFSTLKIQQLQAHRIIVNILNKTEAANSAFDNFLLTLKIC